MRRSRTGIPIDVPFATRLVGSQYECASSLVLIPVAVWWTSGVRAADWAVVRKRALDELKRCAFEDLESIWPIVRLCTWISRVREASGSQLSSKCFPTGLPCCVCPPTSASNQWLNTTVFTKVWRLFFKVFANTRFRASTAVCKVSWQWCALNVKKSSRRTD